MENIFLKQVAKKDSTGTPEDLNAPFSFLEWKQRRSSYADTDVVFHYNRYLIDWFNKNKNKPVSQKFLLRQKYLYLLSQLQLFFTDEEKNQWYNKVNLADEKELLLAIPYFAKKLKTVAQYYLKLRKKLKTTKLKYNLVGTEAGLEQAIQNRLLEVFSSLNPELPPEIQKNLPSFEDLKNNLTVEVEQLYDDTTYFDRDPTVALSAYYDPFHKTTAEFFATKGLTLSSDEWIHDSFNVPITSNFDAFIQQLTGTVFEQADSNLYGSFIQKFLTEDKFTTTFASASSTTITSDITILTGTNYFYYPYGSSDTTLLSGILPSVALSSITIPGATSSTTISGADVIEVKAGDDVRRAWLYYSDYVTDNRTLEADLVEEKTSFIFPFPGYGLSAEDVEWTGSSLSSTPEYPFLIDLYKGAVNEAYWGQLLPADKTKLIPINESTLIESGAFAASTPSNADKVYIRKRDEFNPSSSTITEAAWLFRPQKTNIPVSTTTSTSAILWPFQNVNLAETPIPGYIKASTSFFQEVCEPVDIANLEVPFAVASNEFKYAEKIFKLQRYEDLFIDAIECCWLSGMSLSSDNYSWASQGGFSCKLSAGKVTKFVWTGPDNTPLDQVFTFVSHSPTCPFVTSVDENDPNKCTCKQVYYSPFGHNGSVFSENNFSADYIAVDNSNDLNFFDIGSWRDSLSSTFDNSSEFVWFKTNNKSTWGDGQWVTTNGESPFTLKNGKSYFYKRTTSKDRSFYPPYIVNFKYTQNDTKWIEAKQLANGEWASTDRPSTLKLYPGDIVKWEKQPVNTFYQLSTINYDAFPERRYSAWCTHDYLPLSGSIWPASPDPNPEGPETIIIWPAEPQNLGQDRDSQFPLLSGRPITFADVEKYYWWKIAKQPAPNDFANTYTISAFPPEGTITCNVGTVWTSHTGTITAGNFDIFPVNSLIDLSWPTTYPDLTSSLCYPKITVNEDPQYPRLYGSPVLAQDIDRIYWWKITTEADEYYAYDPFFVTLTGVNAIPEIGLSLTTKHSFGLSLTGTYTFEVSARTLNGDDVYFATIPPILVLPPLVYQVYDSTFVTFSPIVEGTYSVEVSAKLLGSFVNSSPNTISLIMSGIEFKGEDYYFNNIPLITAVPNQVIEKTIIQSEFPVTGYVIQQPLAPLSGKDVKPYWAVLNIDQQDPTRNGTGYQKNYVDGYLPDTFPRISPIQFKFGDVVDYERESTRFTWKQPLVYSAFKGTEEWKELAQESLSGEPDPTNIVLTNFIDGKPAEITYVAKNSFVWQISTEFVRSFVDIEKDITTDLLFSANQPWNVLSNRFYPTIATVPTTENLYSEKESGGFFTPTKLGASQYVNDNFTIETSGSYFQQTLITDDPTIHVGGRGLTKKDQETNYTWQENNQWLKEPFTTNQLTGAVKKNLTKTLQTFVPYQNTIEQKQFGLVTPTSRVSPWGGPEADQWTDTLNEPKGFTGVRNVSAWVETQVLKQNKKVMDGWVTDIYGNQYGLFKTLSADVGIYDRSKIGGQLWVRSNNQIVKPAYQSLSAVFEPFKGINTTVFEQLTGEGILNVDCFFDTLMIETSGAVIHSKLQYDYEDDTIRGLTDDTRFRLLTSTNNLKVQAGQTWFFPTEKKVYNLFTTLSSNALLPELYELNVSDTKFLKQFPYKDSQQTTIISCLSSLSAKEVDTGLLTYNNSTKQFLITLAGKNTSDEQYVAEIVLNDREDLEIDSVTLYVDTKHPAIPFALKTTVIDNYFYDVVPFEVTANQVVTVLTRDLLTVSISGSNEPSYFQVLNFTENTTAYNDGTFNALFLDPGLYHINYKIGNEFGYNLGCLSLSAVNREDVILQNGIPGYVALDGYNSRIIVQE